MFILYIFVCLFFVFISDMPKRIISPEERERRAIYMKDYRIRMSANAEYKRAEKIRTRVRA